MMSTPERVEREINEVLATVNTAIVLSDKLFGPAGLFNQLASTEDQRRTVASSPLFRQAQQRFRELQYQEAEAFARAVSRASANLPAGEHRLKVEP